MINKNVICSLFYNLHEDLDSSFKLNKDIVESDTKIDIMINNDKFTKQDLADEYETLLTSTKEMAYLEGIQDGVNLLHTLLSGNTLIKVTEMLGYKASDKEEIEIFKAKIISELKESN